MAALKILVLDVGGTHLKMLATGQKTPVKIDSGPDFTPAMLVSAVRKAAAGWDYDAVSIGYPGPVLHGAAVSEPHNLGKGWVNFNFRKALGCPVKMVNDAAMQALGSYEGGRMLFLGLGTGLGSAFIVDGIVEPMELAHLPYKNGRTYEEYVGDHGLERLGKKKWRKHVFDVVGKLKAALEADYVVIGGGNARLIQDVSDGDVPDGDLPNGIRLGANSNAFAGGFRLWKPGRKPSRPPKVSDDDS